MKCMQYFRLSPRGLVLVVGFFLMWGITETKKCGEKICGYGTRNDCDGDDCKCKWNFSSRTIIGSDLQICREKCFWWNDCTTNYTCSNRHCVCTEGYLLSEETGRCVKACGGKRCGYGATGECDGGDCKCKWDFSFRTTTGNDVQICRKMCHWEDNCPEKSKCILLGSDFSDYGCDCDVGYTWTDDTGVCVDRNECNDDHRCSDNSHCSNNIGSYKCYCNKGFWETRTGACEDINDCEENYKICDSEPNTVCNNTQGDFRCDCMQGYQRLYDDTECEDINECEQYSKICEGGPNTVCNNTQGGFTCHCLQGYQRPDYNEECKDIDECQDLNICQGEPNSFCNNTQGSFRCDCLSGYTQSAKDTSCYDLNECKQYLNICKNDPNTVCNNTHGGYRCDCLQGYTSLGNNSECEDIDECQGLHSCRDKLNTFCNNTQGSFRCDCLPGYNHSANDTSCYARQALDALEHSDSRSLDGLYIGLPVAVGVLLVVGVAILFIRRRRNFQKPAEERPYHLDDNETNSVAYENVDERSHDSAVSIKMANKKAFSVDYDRVNRYHNKLNNKDKVVSAENSNKKKPKIKQRTDAKAQYHNPSFNNTLRPTPLAHRNVPIQETEAYNTLKAINLKEDPVHKNVSHTDSEHQYNALYDVNLTVKNNTTQMRKSKALEAEQEFAEGDLQEPNIYTDIYDVPQALTTDQTHESNSDLDNNANTEVIYENKQDMSSDYYNLTGINYTHVSSTD